MIPKKFALRAKKYLIRKFIRPQRKWSSCKVRISSIPWSTGVVKARAARKFLRIPKCCVVFSYFVMINLMCNFTPRYWTGLQKLQNPTRLKTFSVRSEFFLYVQKFFCTFRKISRGSEGTEKNFSVPLKVQKKTLSLMSDPWEPWNQWWKW